MRSTKPADPKTLSSFVIGIFVLAFVVVAAQLRLLALDEPEPYAPARAGVEVELRTTETSVWVIDLQRSDPRR